MNPNVRRDLALLREPDHGVRHPFHASEILHQIAASGLNYVEAPVRIEYSAYSLAKGQTLSDTLMILVDLFARRLHR
jgi:hypothetical protein